MLFGNLTRLLELLLPRFSAEGKSYLTIAVGCTGGKHRSVYIAEKLNDWLTEQGERVIINHRDLNREDKGTGRHGGRPGRYEHDRINQLWQAGGRIRRGAGTVVGQMIETICIGPDDRMDNRRQDILDAVARADTGTGVIVLTDMSVARRQSCDLDLEGKIEVIAGVNLRYL